MDVIFLKKCIFNYMSFRSSFAKSLSILIFPFPKYLEFGKRQEFSLKTWQNNLLAETIPHNTSQNEQIDYS